MKALKITGTILGVVLVFFIAIILEEYLRARQRASIPVHLEGNVQAEVTAYVQPDFLWAGQAWWIRVVSKEPVIVDVDSRWQADVSVGTNIIFANLTPTTRRNIALRGVGRPPRRLQYPRKSPKQTLESTAGSAFCFDLESLANGASWWR